MAEEWLYRNNRSSDDTIYHVRITKTGPRGGKRPPLIEARVRAWDYNDAVEFVEAEYMARCKTEVWAG